jgi:hypothetical protein
VAIPKFEASCGAVDLADTAAAFLAARGRRAVFVETAQAAAELLDRPGPDYPVLLTARDTAGEKEIEVFRGQCERAEPLDLSALEALAPVAIDPAALASVLADLRAFVAGTRRATTADLAAGIGSVLPAFRHIPAEAGLDDRI